MSDMVEAIIMVCGVYLYILVMLIWIFSRRRS
jgi:hypothetical protein